MMQLFHDEHKVDDVEQRAWFLVLFASQQAEPWF
jgi:hypothetical protein